MNFNCILSIKHLRKLFFVTAPLHVILHIEIVGKAAVTLKAILTFFRETSMCLNLLQLMGKKWSNARHCHDVLNILVSDLRIQHGEDSTLRKDLNKNGKSNSINNRQRAQNAPTDTTSSKRQKLSSADFAHGKRAEASQQLPLSQKHHISAYNITPNENTLPTVNQGNEFQWLQDPALQPVVPDMQDIFGHLSWENLFQGDDTDSFLWPYNTSDEQDISTSVLGQALDGRGENLAKEQQTQMEDANISALRAMATRDDPPPPGVVREGPASPYVEVRFAEEWE